MRKPENIKRFKRMLNDFLNLKQESLFAIHDPAGVTLFSTLRLTFGLLNENKFRHKFKDALNPMCDLAQKLKQQTTFSCVAHFLQ